MGIALIGRTFFHIITYPSLSWMWIASGLELISMDLKGEEYLTSIPKEALNGNG
jgi:hypothetical protein